MKNLVMLTIGLLIAGPQLFAGNHKTFSAAKDSVKVKPVKANPGREKSAEVRAENYTRWIDKEVQLTPEQRKQVLDVNLSIARKMDDLKKNKTGDKKQMKEKKMALENERDAMLKPILTTVQWDKYVAAKKNKKEEMEEKREEKKEAGKGRKKGHNKEDGE